MRSDLQNQDVLLRVAAPGVWLLDVPELRMGVQVMIVKQVKPDDADDSLVGRPVYAIYKRVVNGGAWAMVKHDEPASVPAVGSTEDDDPLWHFHRDFELAMVQAIQVMIARMRSAQ